MTDQDSITQALSPGGQEGTVPGQSQGQGQGQVNRRNSTHIPVADRDKDGGDNSSQDEKREIVRQLFGDVGELKRDFSCAVESSILLHGKVFIFYCGQPCVPYSVFGEVAYDWMFI